MILVFAAGGHTLPVKVDNSTRGISFEKNGVWVPIDEVYALADKKGDSYDLEVTKAIVRHLPNIKHVEHYLKREYRIGLGAQHLKTVSDDDWNSV